MPIPERKLDTGPRLLLREVVYGQLRSAIDDETLQPGERLHDAELTEWLGVSRTPVREAFARLEHEGLVEMAANRYTRVAVRSAQIYDEAVRVLDALHSWAIANASAAGSAARRDAAAIAETNLARLADEELDAYKTVLHAAGLLTQGLGNSLYLETESVIRTRVVFHAAAPDVSIDWGRVRERAIILSKL